MQTPQCRPKIAIPDPRETETALTCAHGERALQSLLTGDWGWADDVSDALDAAEDAPVRRVA